MRSLFLASLVAIVGVCGCAGVSPTQVGQATGAIAGGAIAPGIGMPIGTLVGALAGMVVEQEIDRKREKTERIDLAQQLQQPTVPSEDQAPGEAAGLPARVWVDEQVHGGQVVAGHFEHRPIP